MILVAHVLFLWWLELCHVSLTGPFLLGMDWSFYSLTFGFLVKSFWPLSSYCSVTVIDSEKKWLDVLTEKDLQAQYMLRGVIRSSNILLLLLVCLSIIITGRGAAFNNFCDFSKTGRLTQTPTSCSVWPAAWRWEKELGLKVFLNLFFSIISIYLWTIATPSVPSRGDDVKYIRSHTCWNSYFVTHLCMMAGFSPLLQNSYNFFLVWWLCNTLHKIYDFSLPFVLHVTPPHCWAYIQTEIKKKTEGTTQAISYCIFL